MTEDFVDEDLLGIDIKDIICDILSKILKKSNLPKDYFDPFGIHSVKSVKSDDIDDIILTTLMIYWWYFRLIYLVFHQHIKQININFLCILLKDYIIK